MSQHDELPEEMELTPAERAAFAALSREREPGRLLEERTVRSLREEGLLSKPEDARRVRFPAAWMAAAAAACIALFAGGFALGQWQGARSMGELAAGIQAETSRQAALQVQQTGSAYVSAMARLTATSDTASPQARQQAREVAQQILRAAADEVIRLSPDDPLASAILAGMDRARQQQARPTPADSTRSLVWF